MTEQAKRLEFCIFDAGDEGDWSFDDFISEIKTKASEIAGGKIRVTSYSDYDDGYRFQIFVYRDETPEEVSARLAQNETERGLSEEEKLEYRLYRKLRPKYEGMPR